MRARSEDVQATPEDPLVAERMALHRAADARRQAMRLDRAGDHAASRQLLHETHALLQRRAAVGGGRLRNERTVRHRGSGCQQAVDGRCAERLGREVGSNGAG